MIWGLTGSELGMVAFIFGLVYGATLLPRVVRFLFGGGKDARR